SKPLSLWSTGIFSPTSCPRKASSRSHPPSSPSTGKKSKKKPLKEKISSSFLTRKPRKISLKSLKLRLSKSHMWRKKRKREILSLLSSPLLFNKKQAAIMDFLQHAR